MIFKPFRVNVRGTIREASLEGIVENITLMHTIIRNYQFRRIIIPNSIISDEVIVNSDLVEQKICEWIVIRISFQADVEEARRLIQEEVEKHPLLIDTRTILEKEQGVPKVVVRVIEIEEDAVKLRVYAWVQNSADGFDLKCSMLEAIKKRFDQEGVELALPYKNISIKHSTPITQATMEN